MSGPVTLEPSVTAEAQPVAEAPAGAEALSPVEAPAGAEVLPITEALSGVEALPPEDAVEIERPIPPPPEPPLSVSPPPQRVLKSFENFLIPLLVLFLLGNALAYALPQLPFARLTVGLPLILVLGGLLFSAGGKSHFRWSIRCALWAMSLVVGSLYYGQLHFQPSTLDVGQLAPLDRVEVMGTVTGLNAPNRAVVRVKTVDGRKAEGQLLAYLPKDTQPVEAGTRVLLVGDLKAPFHSVIPGTFDQARYLSAQHITAVLKNPHRLVAFEISQEPGFSLQRLTDQLKSRVAETFSAYLPERQAEVLGGIVLGDKAIPVDRDTRQAFIQTGLVHVLAASGLNVGIIAGAVLWLLSLSKLPFRARIGIAMGAVAFYSLLTGLPPSIQRAAAMLEIALLLKMLDRELAPVFLLCVAGTLLVLTNPDNIASIGFQFSMLTTFGLLTMVPPLQERLGYYITRTLAGVVLVPTIAQLWIWPLSVYYFNQFPIHTVPLNVLAILLVTPLTVIGFASGVISLIIPPVAGWLSMTARPFLDLLLWLVQWGQEMRWAQWSLPSPSAWQLVVLYAQLFVLLGLMVGLPRFKQLTPTRKALVGLLPLTLLLAGVSVVAVQASSQTTIDLLPLSYDREAYIIHPPGKQPPLALIPSGLRYFEARAVADYLKHRHVTELSAVLLLPDAAPPTQLRTALKQTRIGTVFYAPGNPPSLPVKTKAFPANGASLKLGALTIEGRLPALRIRSSNYCLLSIHPQFQHNASCALQAVHDPAGTRLFSQGGEELEARQYYRLQQNAQHLDVY